MPLEKLRDDAFRLRYLQLHQSKVLIETALRVIALKERQRGEMEDLERTMRAQSLGAGLTNPAATDADDAAADRMCEYIAIAKSAESDSGKTSRLTVLLREEQNQSLLECFRDEGQWHGHGAEAHFEGAPNWRVVIAKLESFSELLRMSRWVDDGSLICFVGDISCLFLLFSEIAIACNL